MGKVAIGIKKSIQVKILHQKVVPCHCQSLQQRFREDCSCLLYLQIGDLAISSYIQSYNQLALKETAKPFFGQLAAH